MWIHNRNPSRAYVETPKWVELSLVHKHDINRYPWTPELVNKWFNIKRLDSLKISSFTKNLSRYSTLNTKSDGIVQSLTKHDKCTQETSWTQSARVWKHLWLSLICCKSLIFKSQDRKFLPRVISMQCCSSLWGQLCHHHIQQKKMFHNSDNFQSMCNILDKTQNTSHLVTILLQVNLVLATFNFQVLLIVVFTILHISVTALNCHVTLYWLIPEVIVMLSLKALINSAQVLLSSWEFFYQHYMDLPLYLLPK